MTQTILYIDHDINYKSWFTSQKYEAVKTWLPKIKAIYGDCEVWIRESSTGKVHLKLLWERDIGMLDQMQIRALLADDVYRLVLDLKRSWKHPEEANRIFDEKYVDGMLHKAGEWKKLPIMF
jgi:hypothetical protein